MQNGVNLDVYEGEIQAKTSKKKLRGKKGEKKRKEK